MTAKHQKFCDYYLETGNAAEAARRVGYAEESAKQSGARLLRREDVKQYLSDKMQAFSEKEIASAEEVLKFLTDTIRDEDCTRKDRLKAAELLGRRYRMFNDSDPKEDGDEKTTIEFIFKDTSMNESETNDNT